jgi:DNA-binding CsgD family transcriptional regulator
MITINNTFVKETVEAEQEDSVDCDNFQKGDFLQDVIEGLQDGILIVTETGELVLANASGYRFCYQINQGNSKADVLPPAIWQLCESLIESRTLFPDQVIILSDEIVLDKLTIFRVRVRWLDSKLFENPCLLVTIENRYESVKNAAIAEIKRYDLTRREGEIWLLYRSNYSYKEIATELYITVNTVKKHMKNIHAKRQAFLEIEE